MITSLRLRAHVRLPPGRSGAFDHGDVDSLTRRLFVAHTDFGTVDVIDPDSSEAVGTIAGCPEGSGVLCAAAPRQVFAASRGSGKVLLIDPDQLHTIGEVAVGPKPNGLAWAATRGLLLVADVDPADKAARLVDPLSLEVTAQTPLPGRPRWCVFDDRSDRFLVNIRDPASLISLATSGEISGSWPISSSGPHGLDLDREHGLAFVACDGGHIVIVDLVDGR